MRRVAFIRVGNRFLAGTRGHIANNPALAGLSAGFESGTKAGTKRGQSGDTSIYERKKILHSYTYNAYHFLPRLPPPGPSCTLTHLHGSEREKGLPLAQETGRGGRAWPDGPSRGDGAGASGEPAGSASGGAGWRAKGRQAGTRRLSPLWITFLRVTVRECLFFVQQQGFAK